MSQFEALITLASLDVKTDDERLAYVGQVK
jgi:hypothetical protein